MATKKQPAPYLSQPEQYINYSALDSFLDQPASQSDKPEEQAGVGRSLADVAIKGAQGVVGLGQSAVGLADLATGGLAGKGMQYIGYDPDQTNAAMGEYLSDSQKRSDKAVDDAEGFIDTAIAAVKNPRFILGSLAQSAPGILAMGAAQSAVAARIAAKAALGTAEGAAASAGLTGTKAIHAALATKAGNEAASAAVNAAAGKLIGIGAASEGAQAAGQIADQAQRAGRNYTDYALPAIAAGMGNAAISFGTGKLLGDAATEMFTGAKQSALAGSRTARILHATGSEGTQETLQSGQEQFFTNAAMGEPDLMKGVAEQAAQGGVTGAVMGGALGGGSKPHAQAKKEIEDKYADQRAAVDRMRAAGDTAAADAMERTIGKKIGGELSTFELGRMGEAAPEADFHQNPVFQQQYQGMRQAGTTPAEAAARAAAVSKFWELGKAGGLSDKAITAAVEAARNQPIDTIGTFLGRYADTLRGKGMGQVGNVSPDLDDAIEQAMTAVATAIYGNAMSEEKTNAALDLMDKRAQRDLAAQRDFSPEPQGEQDVSTSQPVPAVAPGTDRGGSPDAGASVDAGLGVAGQRDTGLDATSTAGEAAAVPARMDAAGQPSGALEDSKVVGSDAGNGFKHGPQNGERYRVGVVDSVGGAIAIEKRYPAGTAGTFYVGKDGNLIDGDAINLIGSGKEKLWIPATPEQARQAQQILDEMGQLDLQDPARKDAKERLKQVVSGKLQEASAQANAAGVQPDAVAPSIIQDAGKQHPAPAVDTSLSNAEQLDNDGRKLNDGLKDNGKILTPGYYSEGYPWQTGWKQESGTSISIDGRDILAGFDKYRGEGMRLRDAIRHAEIAGDPVPQEAIDRLATLQKQPDPRLTPVSQRNVSPEAQSIDTSAAPVEKAAEIEQVAPKADGVKIPERIRYYVTKSPAYDGIEPLSVEDADFELEALENSAKKGRLTPGAFAQSEIGKRIDGASIIALQSSLKADPVGTIQALRSHIENKSEPARPVAESQALAPSGSSDGGVATAQAGSVPIQEKTGYQLPETDLHTEWLRSEHPDFSPTPRQQLVMDAVRQARSEGKSYNREIEARVAEILGVGKDVLDQNKSNVEGGDFGYDVYHANKAVRAQDGNRTSKEIADKLNLKPGDLIGTMVTQDGKQSIGVTIKAVSDTGLSYEIEGKRGRAVVTGTMGADAIKNSIDRAHEKGRRKDNFDAFVAARTKSTPTTEAPSRTDTFDTTLKPDGTLAVKGDLEAIHKALAEAEIPKRSIIDTKDGVLVGKTQAAKAKAKFASKADLEHLFGIDQKRAKALDRIAKGTAYFAKESKAKEYVKDNGLGDTHEVQRHSSGANRWDVVAKPIIQSKEQAQTASNGRTALSTSEQKDNETPVSSQFTGQPDPRNTPPMQALDGYAVGDVVDIPQRTFGRGKVEVLYKRQMAGMDPGAMARVVRDDGKKLDVLTSELKKADDGKHDDLMDDAEMRGYEQRAGTEKKSAPVSRLTQARNDLMDMQAKADAQGRVVDDRLLSKIRQQQKVINDLEAEQAAKDKMMAAAADLASLLGKNTRANITPEQEQKMLPIVIRLFEGAMELGIVKFKEAARYVREFITNAIDKEAADAIPIDTLQGAYIATARRHADKEVTPKAEVVAVNSIEELEEPAAAKEATSDLEKPAKTADTSTQDTPNDSTATRKLESSGPGASAGEQPAAAGKADRQREAGPAPDRRSGLDQQGNENPDGPGRDLAGSVGNDAGKSPVPARSGRSGGRSSSKRGVQGTARTDAGDDLFATPRGEVNPAPNAPPVPAPQFKPADFTITDELGLGEGGQKAKFRNNVDAIKLLAQLEREDRQATPDEQAVLARYVGWGGLPQAFDKDNRDWAREYAEITALMSPEELDAARQSTRYAHFTSKPIIEDGIYAALRRFGFTGGRTLEAGAGVGNFIGLMPADMRTAGRFTAIEREPFSYAIAKHLYPNQVVVREDFTRFKGDDGYYDAAVGNPPFASDPQTDASGRKHLSGLSLHNYFFAKEVDMLREGGILAQVITNSFLDAAGDRARKYISDRTKFLGAIRLPNSAFAKNANTEVTTDLIFLQKRPESEWGNKATKEAAKAWLNVVAVEDKRKGVEINLNQYFVDHPEMMLGDWGAHGTMYGPNQPALIARKGQDTLQMLRDAVQRLPADVYQSAALIGTSNATDSAVVALSNPTVQEGGYYLDGDTLMQRLTDRAGEARAQKITPLTQWTEKTKLGDTGFERIKALAAMRVTLRDLLAAELAGKDTMEGLRAQLNQQYDAYAKKHGLINDPATSRVFDDDPDFPLLLSLEHNYVPGMGETAAKRQGLKPTKSSATKGPIFKQRVVDARKSVQKVETPADALAVSMAERGRLDTAYIGKLLGKEPGAVLKELSEGDKPLLFLDPATDEYVLRDAYLSGNVRAKLATARQAGMTANARALEAVQPEDVGSHEIIARVGSPWIPEAVYEDFAKHLLGDGTNASIRYVKLNSGFSVYVTPGSELNNTNKWGTKKYPADALLSALLNNKTIKVTWKDKEGTHTDIAATEKANDKAQEIREAFQDWLFKDSDRSEVLVRAYNDTNNNYVTRNYDGGWMTFPGKVPDSIIKFRRHQRNAIARIVQDRTALLDHVVGAGKTFTIVSAAMELRRTGLARKPMVAVPNHLVKQWAADFYRLYPGANILTATKKDFEKANRRRFLAKIATGDWDAVVIAHSSFGFIKPGSEFEADFNQRQVKLIMDTIKAVEDQDGDDKAKKRTVKQLEGMKERLENRIKSLRDKPMDDLLDFKEIGIDQLFVDEAHMFKNLMFSTKMQNVAGLGDSKGSQRAYDMYVKSQQVLEQNGRGQGLVFATGTPVSNSLAEKYHMMRYLMPDAMKAQGFDSFDAWANTFASVEQVWMQKPSGDGFKATNRMSNFVNVHELLKMFDQVADTVTLEDIKKAFREENEGREFPIPPVKTGRRQPVSLVKSEAQESYMREIAARAKILEQRKGPPKKGEDNTLVIMTDARKAAMDIRLVDITVTEREKGGRLDKSADEILARYKKFDAVKGTQLVFSDLGTPKKHAQAELKEYNALQERIAKATDEVNLRASLGAEDAQEIVDDAEAAQAELDKQGQDWITAVQAAIRGFSVYDDLRDALIERGIPENEIAFIHDYNTDERKAGLFRKVNSGAIRVLIGSTAKMGAGTNVQERLVALHHLDVPWRPSDVEQREGRIERQGNALLNEIPGFEVEILAYVTQDTLDMRMWQIQEVKLKMINQLRTRKIGREIDNAFEDLEMSAGEMQAAATGNMDLLREIQARADIKKLEQKHRSFDGQKNDLINRKRSVANELARLPREIAAAKVLAEGGNQYKEALDAQEKSFTVTIDGQQYKDRFAAQRYLLDKVDATVLDPNKPANEDGTPATKAAPLSVDMNGVTYTARARLQEAWAELRGDVNGFQWEVDGKTYKRVSEMAKAIQQRVADAVADEVEEQIGKIGPFVVSVEGVSKRGEKRAEVLLSYKGMNLDKSLFAGADKNPITAIAIAENIAHWADRRVRGLAADLTYFEERMQRAQKQQKELESAQELGDWPDQDKLDAARAKHKEILGRLASAGQKTTTEGLSTNPRFTGAPEGNDTDVVWPGGFPAVFSRGDNGAGRYTTDQVEDAIGELTKGWTIKPDIKVIQTMEDSPDKVREYWKSQDSKGALGGIEGFHYRGQVYIVASAMNKPADVVRVLFHESLGHFGLRNVFGNALDDVLDQIAVARRPEVVRKAGQYKLDLSKQSERRMAAEEVLAEMAQTRPEIGFVRRAIAAIKTWLRANVPFFRNMALTDDEILHNIILPARGFVERGRRAATAAPELVPAFSQKAGIWRSALEDGVFNINAKALTPAMWKDGLKGLVNKGLVKQDEIAWSGLDDWLTMQQGKVPKEAVLQYLQDNGVKVTETMLGDAAFDATFAEEGDDGRWYVYGERANGDDVYDTAAEANSKADEYNADIPRGPTKYSQYTLPGGQNYRELLLTLPAMDAITEKKVQTPNGWGNTDGGNVGIERTGNTGADFRSGHWDQPNVLAHIRFNERTDAQGNRVLFIEEFQSDWGQAGKKRGFFSPSEDTWTAKRVGNWVPSDDSLGKWEVFRNGESAGWFKGNAESEVIADAKSRGLSMNSGIPAAPFVTKTDAWVSLAMKRMIRYAVDNGFDKIAFVNGAQSAERYDLSKSVDEIKWGANGNTGKTVYIQLSDAGTATLLVNSDGKVVGSRGAGNAMSNAEGKQLDDVIGKDIANQIMSEKEGALAGDGLDIGGEGMRAFYDKIVPAVAKDVLKKLGGGQMEAVDINIGDKEAAEKWKRMTANSAIPSTPIVESSTQPGFTITPAMREKASQGLPMFSKKAQSRNEFKSWPKYIGWDRKDHEKVAALLPDEYRSDPHRREPLPATGGNIQYPAAVWDDIEALNKDYGGRKVFRLDPLGNIMVELGRRGASLSDVINKAVPIAEKHDIGIYVSHVLVPQMGALTISGFTPEMGLASVVMRAAKTNVAPIKAFDNGYTRDFTSQGTVMSYKPRGFSQVLFSRASDATIAQEPYTFANRARDLFHDIADKQTTFNWWNNTVGTQYQKAQQDKHFKRVFDATQDYILDVSRLANQSADLARDLLPKLENFSDVLKHTATADVQAIAKPVFQGTLSEKRVYRPEELKRVFGLTDKQVELYKQFRQAVDKSIDDLSTTTAAKLMRYAGFPINMLQDEIEAGDHKELAKMAAEVAKEDPKAKGLAKQIAEISDRAQTLKAEGYAPLMRFGQYAVSVRDPLTKELKQFYLLESQAAANKKARMVAGAGIVEQSVMSTKDYQLLKGVSPESLELFGDILEKAGMFDTRDELFQTYLRRAIDQRSAMKRMIERHGYPGYSEDMRRVLATFVTSNARLASKNLHFSNMLEAAENIPKEKGDVRDEATALVKYVQEPVEEAPKIRGLLFANYLGGSVASALTNMTQTITMTVPYLSQFSNPLKAGTALAKGMKQAVTEVTDKDLANALAKAEQAGLVSPQEIHHLNAEAMGTFGSHPAVQKAMFLWGSLFSLAEQFNRKSTFIAAFNMARELGKRDPYAFAQQAVEETQGIYNRGNRPDWARGAIGATVFTFKQFSISYLEFLSRLPAREKVLALAILMLAAGGEGLPFADDLDDIIDTIAQKLGYNFNSKKKKREFIGSVLGQGGADFVLKGMSAIPGLPIDVSGRMGMANLIPGSGVMRKDAKDHMADALEVLGPAGGFMRDAVNKTWLPTTASELSDSAFTPVAIRNLAKSADMFQTGMYRDTKGRKVIDTTAADAIWKAIGFQPAEVARESQRARIVQQGVSMAKISEAEIADQMAQARFEGSIERYREAREKMEDWNRKNPESRMSITTDQIARRVKEMKMERDQRIIKSAPRELRGNVKAQLVQ